MMTQLNPPIPLKTPKGDAWAVALIDYGPQWDLQWVTFIKETGECWTFRNPEVRQAQNYTFGLPKPTPISAPDRSKHTPQAAQADTAKAEMRAQTKANGVNGAAANGHGR